MKRLAFLALAIASVSCDLSEDRGGITGHIAEKTPLPDRCYSHKYLMTEFSESEVCTPVNTSYCVDEGGSGVGGYWTDLCCPNDTCTENCSEYEAQCPYGHETQYEVVRVGGADACDEYNWPCPEEYTCPSGCQPSTDCTFVATDEKFNCTRANGECAHEENCGAGPYTQSFCMIFVRNCECMKIPGVIAPTVCSEHEDQSLTCGGRVGGQGCVWPPEPWPPEEQP